LSIFQDVTRELLGDGYGVRFRPGGHSMHPTIRDGEAVTVAPVKASEVRRGDIILFQTACGLLAHRVLKIESGPDAAPVFITRGDASTSSDRPVSASSVLGRIINVERDGRTRRLDRRRWKILDDARRRLSRLKAGLRPGPN
jgi:hypothetical protein